VRLVIETSRLPARKFGIGETPPNLGGICSRAGLGT
jgi:hypothetical protein